MQNSLQFGAKTYHFDPTLKSKVASCITRADNLTPDDETSSVFWHYQMGRIGGDQYELKLSGSEAAEAKAHKCMTDALDQVGLECQAKDTKDLFTITEKEEGDGIEKLSDLLAPAPQEGGSIWDRTRKN